MRSSLQDGHSLVNFDPIQEIGPKVGGGHSFVSGPFLRDYSTCVVLYLRLEEKIVKLTRDDFKPSWWTKQSHERVCISIFHT